MDFLVFYWLYKPWDGALLLEDTCYWILCVQYEQLQLTYRPEEGPSEETKISSDELEPPASDNAAVSNVEITPTPTPPTPPPPPPQNNLETGDLLVNLKVLCFSN